MMVMMMVREKKRKHLNTTQCWLARYDNEFDDYQDDYGNNFDGDLIVI